MKTREKHLLALHEVLHRLENTGLPMIPEVVYLGHKINAEGLQPVADKVDAIQAAPAPKNVGLSLNTWCEDTSYLPVWLSLHHIAN